MERDARTVFILTTVNYSGVAGQKRGLVVRNEGGVGGSKEKRKPIPVRGNNFVLCNNGCRNGYQYCFLSFLFLFFFLNCRASNKKVCITNHQQASLQ